MRTAYRWLVRTATGGTVAAVFAAAGCGLGVPNFYPVHGRVTYKWGGDTAKLTGARIVFESLTEPKVTGTGEVGADGGFAVGCFFAGRDRPGLPEAEYRVYLQPPASEEDARKRAQMVPARYRTVESSPFGWTVGPGDNVVAFEIDAGK
jgi:hypothetical protein